MVRRRTLRLTFSYRGQKVDVVSVERVAMTPPPSDPLEERLDMSGFWYELLDANGRRLYRRIACNPIGTTHEVLTEDPARPIERVQLGELEGTFLLLAPDLRGAATLVLVGSEPDTSSAANEIARFDVRQLPSGRS